jgi:hypothetical protein
LFLHVVHVPGNFLGHGVHCLGQGGEFAALVDVQAAVIGSFADVGNQADQPPDGGENRLGEPKAQQQRGDQADSENDEEALFENVHLVVQAGKRQGDTQHSGGFLAMGQRWAT